MLRTTANPVVDKTPFRHAPAGRVFHVFEEWHLVPASDLLQLRWALNNSSSAGTAANDASGAALLRLVDSELSRRSAFQSPPVPVQAG
ncbi:hypothetical protein [Arthrobacter sp. AD-310]